MNSDSRSKRVCLVPRLEGVGGMVSFQEKLTAGLLARRIEVCYDLDDFPYESILVIGGTRQLGKLWRARRRGIRVVQRLDGMNWLHRLIKTGIRHYLRAEYGNLLLAFIRTRLADMLVYQSEFALKWWEMARRPSPKAHTVIYNGVNLAVHHPDADPSQPPGVVRLLVVEGSLMGGYELGLVHAVSLSVEMGNRWPSAHSHNIKKPIELMIVGRVTPEIQAHWTRQVAAQTGENEIRINWAGLVPRTHVPDIDRSAHLLFSSDLNAACPNSVIEALACGTPVVAFDTGSLPELLAGGGGKVVAYGGDPWKLEKPDFPALAQAAHDILNNLGDFRKAARANAEIAFGLEQMVDRYLEILLDK